MTEIPDSVRGPGELPRLIYIADVPVESSYHGSALLHRLLRCYPRDKLLIVEAGDSVSVPSRRLDGYEYRRATLAGNRVSRLIQTRFVRAASALQILLAGRAPSSMQAMARDFNAQAVLTVAHGYSWRAAAAVAQRLELPLHLIVHDDFPTVTAMPASLRGWLDRRFAAVYRQAASRLCVSPSMSEEYEARYGVTGTVLYPSQARDTPPATIAREAGAGFTVAYAGNLTVGDYRNALRILAASLRSMDGRLVVFGPFTPADVAHFGLDLPNVSFPGAVANADMIAALRRQADVLFLPMSFEDGYQTAMRLSFPSKMIDYLASGIPMLIRGPDYSSAVRWARENPGSAEVVTSESETDLLAALRRLKDDPSHGNRLSARALAVGTAMFGFPVVTRTFLAAVACARDGLSAHA